MATNLRVSEERGSSSALKNWLSAFHAARSEAWGDTTGYLFILPAVALFAIFGAWPVIRGLELAFTDYRYLIVDHSPFVGIRNFVEMAKDTDFREAFQRSLYFTAWYLPPNIILPLILASLIARVRNGTLAATYRVTSYLPVVLPTSVAILLWSELFNSQFGYINVFIKNVLHLSIQPAWLSDPKLIIPTMAMASVWKHMGSNTLLFLVGMYNIPGEVYESASIDGAGGFQQWRHITLPLIRPMLVLVLVLSAEILSGTQEALILFNGGGPQNAAMTAGVYAYLTAFRIGDMRWGYAAAINLTMGVFHMIIAATVFKLVGTDRTHG
jgi:ABC-type sugar transport system permease subunit